MSNIVEYDANKNDVAAVTVFQTNRAEVKRSIKVALKDGQNDVEVKNLPTCLDQDSIRVDGIGNAVIFDVVYHPSPPIDNKRQEAALKYLNKRQSELSAELDIVKRQSEVLKEYSTTLKGSDTNADQLETFLTLYSSRQKEYNEELAKLTAEIDDVDVAIQETSVTLNADEESIQQRGVRVTIVVLGEGDGDAELSLTYVVSNAWWTPLYDLRAFIAPDEKSESTINLHYRASIRQSTGENWKGVDLKLSTASPLQGTTIPSLEPHWVSEYVPPPPPGRKSMKRGGGLSMPSMPIVGGAMRSVSYYSATVNGDLDFGAPPAPAFFSVRQAVAAEGAVSSTFAIPGLSNIPSDSLSSSQTHKVSIAEIALSSVDLEWITVPKDTPSAFLQCKVKNTSDYTLLSGQASVFMNNNFVAKSSIPVSGFDETCGFMKKLKPAQRVSPQESFSCSLGVDPAVRVTYHPQTKKTKTLGSVLSTKTTATAFEQRISVKNTRRSSIGRLIVKDQVPVSRMERIKVALVEPRDLHGAKVGAKAVQVRDGVVAQWSRSNDAVPATDDGEEPALGLIEWVCQLAAGANVDVTLAWDVSAPTGVVWTKQ